MVIKPLDEFPYLKTVHDEQRNTSRLTIPHKSFHFIPNQAAKSLPTDQTSYSWEQKKILPSNHHISGSGQTDKSQDVSAQCWYFAGLECD